MLNVSRHRTLIWLCLSAFVGQAGCATLVAPRPAVSEDVRAQLGTVAVVSAGFRPKAELRLPARGRAAGAGRGAAVGAGSTVVAGAYLAAGAAAGGGQFGPIFAAGALAGGFALAPVGALVGSVGGALKAPPRAAVEEAEATLRTALAELEIQEALRDQVLGFAREHTPHSFVLFTEGGPGALGGQVNYAALAGQGIGTVLEVSVTDVGLAGKWRVNPPVKLVMAVQTRLVRTSDGTVLYTFNPTYASTERRFTEWAVDNAGPFRDRLDRAYRSLAESIVEELFVLYVPGRSGRSRDGSAPREGVAGQPASE